MTPTTPEDSMTTQQPSPRNEAAERMRRYMREADLTDERWIDLLDAALSEERRRTLERLEKWLSHDMTYCDLMNSTIDGPRTCTCGLNTEWRAILDEIGGS